MNDNSAHRFTEGSENEYEIYEVHKSDWDAMTADEKNLTRFYHEKTQLKAENERLKANRFTMPTDKQVMDIAVLFNEGKLELDKLADMVAMCNFVIDRLHENGNVTTPSKKEKL